MLGRADEACAHAAEAARSAGEPYLAGCAEATWGCALFSKGNVESARDHFASALKAFTQLGAAGDAALILNNLGVCSLYAGDLQSAYALCRQALERSRAAQYEFSSAHALHSIALCEVRSSALGPAQAHLRRASAEAGRLGDRELQLMCAEAEAELAFGRGRPRRGTRLLLLSQRARALLHAPRSAPESEYYDRLLSRERDAGGAQRYEAAAAAVAGLAPDRVLDALRHDDFGALSAVT